MRLDAKTVSDLARNKQINPAIASQIMAAQKEVVAATPAAKKRQPKPVESKGEASVRIALINHFGDWFKGGEVVCEFRPFAQREFRADFALPRLIVVEVDGWQHHGRTLDAHHSDRLRGIYFAQYGWLAFRLSHQQAVNEPTRLLDALDTWIRRAVAVPRDTITIERITTATGYRTQLQSGHDDA